jgi:hypothetical protein
MRILIDVVLFSTMFAFVTGIAAAAIAEKPSETVL